MATSPSLVRPDKIHQAVAAGASGYHSKVLTGPQIVGALERVVAGEMVILPGEDESPNLPIR